MTIHKHRIETNGLVSILVPKFKGWLSSRLLQPYVRHPHIVLSLDKLGSATYLLCDGQHTVEQIFQVLEEKFGTEIHPAGERITKFLHQLHKDRLIRFA